MARPKINTKITADLGDPKWIHLMKWEAQKNHSTQREVLLRALEVYFAHKLENQALVRASDSIFDEWNDPRDSDYDKL